AERLRLEELARRTAAAAAVSAAAAAGGAGAGVVAHDGDVIARQSGPFEELFRLLECAHGLQDQTITKAVWDLLMSLPTQYELARRVKE
ncbi:unnamed protein product, partial [Ectocarpus sp. 12 AP-2014]